MSHHFRQGDVPILVSFPHNGTTIPPDVAATMTPEGLESRDTDWFLDRLYDFPELADSSQIVAGYSRYVIDLNRPSDNRSLYPGQTSTGLIPLTRFDGSRIYIEEPDSAEQSSRVTRIWQPYHDRIESELRRLVQEHGVAVLVEAHSIESKLPRLFEGTLPDFNIGTNEGRSCDDSLSYAVMNVLHNQSQYSHVLDGRFVGGYITRHYGRPAGNVHAIQFELSQSTYLQEQEKVWEIEKVRQVRPVFQRIIREIKSWLKLHQN